MSDTDPYAGPNVYYPPAEVTVEEPVETPDESAEVVALTAIENAPADADTDTEEVPTGTIAEILAWVGTDRDRAARALAAEQAGQNRKSLLKNLTTGS